MNHQSRVNGLLVALAAVSILLTVGASAQVYDSTARPLYRVGKGGPATDNAAAATSQLPQWTYTFSYGGQNLSATIVGTDPFTTNTTSTITIAIIPVKMVYGAKNGNTTFDPNTSYVGSTTATELVAGSPLFNSTVDYVQGGVNVGTTQYEDAYERASFWQGVSTNTDYHVLFAKPIVTDELTYNVTCTGCKVKTGLWSTEGRGTMDYPTLDAYFQSIIKKYKQITPNILPLFLTYNVYLTEIDGLECCIGGYHNALGSQPTGQTYAYATIASQGTAPVFSQDISALSHELGEWLTDPFVDNIAPTLCSKKGNDNSLMEVGDPLENNADFGDYPYVVGGFTYHPQDLVTFEYFGAPANTSVNNWFTFQGESLTVCQNGG